MANDKEFGRFFNLERLISTVPGKILVIQGPRGAGKTRTLRKIVRELRLDCHWDSGDSFRLQQLFRDPEAAKILQYIQSREWLVVEEAQKIPNLREGLEIIRRHKLKLKIILSSSWRLDLATAPKGEEERRTFGQNFWQVDQQLGSEEDPWEEQKTIIDLLPLSQAELNQKYTRFQLRELLPWFLIFGTYPQVIRAANKPQIEEFLGELVFSQLLPEVVIQGRVKKPEKLLQLSKQVAFRIGEELSLNELSELVGVDVKTIDRYLELLEKALIIKKISPFSRNLKREIDFKAKYYFYDTGVRNALISQFNELENRNDGAALWENFLVMERIKMFEINQKNASFYFWRTYDGQRVNWIEETKERLRGGESKGELRGYQFQWKQTNRKRSKAPQDWLRTYPVTNLEIIRPSNYLDFLI